MIGRVSGAFLVDFQLLCCDGISVDSRFLNRGEHIAISYIPFDLWQCYNIAPDETLQRGEDTEF